MRRVRVFALSAGVLAICALSSTSRSDASVITCNDDGQTYTTGCPADATNGRCIDPAGTLGGCCNKGTCSGSVCNLGGGVDAACLNDGNPCTNDACTQGANYQANCTHQPSAAGTACDLDSNVCTIDQCDGSSNCVSTGNVNTCAAEQAANPAPQPICAPWKCNPTTGCAKTPVPNDPATVCDDGKDCTSGDICINGVCGKGSSGSLVANGYPCRADDTNLADGDQRTWCKAGTCDGSHEYCTNPHDVADGAPCDPNPCTNSTCTGSGKNGICTVNSCNVGQSVFCQPCGTTFNCIDFGAGGSANQKNPCGCLSNF